MKSNRTAVISALLCTLAIASSVFAVTTNEKPSPKGANDKEAVELLHQIEARHGATQSVTGKYHQISADPDQQVGGTIESDADFYLLKPNKFRADYQPPHQSTDLISGQTYYQYTPALGQVTVYQFKNQTNVRDLNYLLLGFGAHADDVLKVYTVKWLTEGVDKQYYGIQLVPIKKDEANFKYITMLVTADANLLPAQFSMEQLSGLRLTVNLSLKALKPGAKISESKFADDFPKSAKRVDIE